MWGLKELLRAAGAHHGQQTALKTVLRDMVKSGQLEREGKRYRAPRSRDEGKHSESAQLSEGGSRAAGPQPAGKKGGRAAFGEARGFSKRKGQPERGQSRSTQGRHDPQPRGHERRQDNRRDQNRRDQNRGSKPSRFEPERAQARPRPGATIVEGTLHLHPDGYGFVHPADSDQENIFVPPDQAARALAGDRVQVEVVPGRGGRTMGRLVSVAERTRQMVIGEYVESRHGAHVETDLGPVIVPKTQIARHGDRVKVRLGIGKELLGVRDTLTGEVAGSFGSQSDESVEVLSIAYAQGFHDEFPPEVMDEADRFPSTVSWADAQALGRKDLTTLSLVTIDGEDARDFDDAIYVEPKGDGYRLVVAIADVAHYVKEGTALDSEARRRATSVYMPGRVLPMLPERLSNGLCSLKPDELRLCLVADMTIDRHGTTTATELYPAVMKSVARCTYNEVHAVLAGEDVPHRNQFKPLFERLFALSKVLTAMRKERGAIDFDLPETRVEIDENGKPLGMVRRERLESHRIVEECMLAANEAVARFFREEGLPTVNRYHGEPDEEKLEAFAQVARAHGVPVKYGKLTSKELNALLESIAGHSEQRALNQLLLRSMMQAVYSSQNAGHYGLGAEDYLHFTSPIRRYPDTLVHRLLHRLWAHGGHAHKGELEAEEERLEGLAVHSSERERAAMKVEREVTSFYSALLMQEHLGEVLTGVVSGLSDSGFFVELDNLYIDGMVRPTGGRWRFDQARHMGLLAGQPVKVGAKVTVRVSAVSVERRQVDLELQGALERRSGPVATDAPVRDSDRRPGRSAGKGHHPSRHTNRPAIRHDVASRDDAAAVESREQPDEFDERAMPSGPPAKALRMLEARRAGGKAGQAKFGRDAQQGQRAGKGGSRAGGRSKDRGSRGGQRRR